MCLTAFSGVYYPVFFARQVRVTAEAIKAFVANFRFVCLFVCYLCVAPTSFLYVKWNEKVLDYF